MKEVKIQQVQMICTSPGSSTSPGAKSLDSSDGFTLHNNLTEDDM